MNIEFPTIVEGGHEYIETKPGHPVNLVLLHGLFGAMSNFKCILDTLAQELNVVIPMLPFFELPIKQVNVVGLKEYIEEFVRFKAYNKIHILGNSVGGHIGLYFSIDNADLVESLTLTGSSGLFETGLGSSYPRRGDYDYIREMSVKVFYDTTLATKEMIDEVYDTVNDPLRAIRVLHIARSAIRFNLRKTIGNIKSPVLLIWGKEDTITPPFVAEEFESSIENSELHWISECGHAPMMEKPHEFTRILNGFLLKIGALPSTQQMESNR